jgi:protocadherin Fat 1/2/3
VLLFIHSGAILVSGKLDYEMVKEYVMTVEASDGGEPSLSSSAVVNIEIVDANDNWPIFIQAEYQSVVREDVAVNTTLLQVD